MGKGYLVDTNTLVDAQTKKLPPGGLSFIAKTLNEDFTISFISYIEFLGYRDATKAMEEFIALAKVIEINKSIIEATVSLRKSKRIKLPDAIIAATAIVTDRILITRNTVDFANIDGLTFVNPWNI